MLTVFMATRNGGLTLPRVLEAYTALSPPPSGWKLVVIDNRSEDNTCDIVHSFRDRLPLTYMFEGKLGKNAALNTGLTKLEGDLAVFTDDDTFPRPDWLICLHTAAVDHPSYSMFGGVIVPRWQATPPEWLSYVPAAPFFALTDLAQTEGPTEAGNLFGPNIAVRAEVFRCGARFNESIGPRAGSYAMGGETEFLQRLSRLGHKAWHVRTAVVEHYIREYQMDKSWLLGRAIRFGRGQFLVSQWDQPSALPGWPAVAAHLAPRICRRMIRIAGAWLTSNERELFTAQRELCYNWGILIEAHRARRQRAIFGDRQALLTSAEPPSTAEEEPPYTAEESYEAPGNSVGEAFKENLFS